LFVALTLLLAYPLSVAPASTILPLGPDSSLFLWTLSWDMHAGAFERRQTMYMLHSMAHWQKTVHGYSGLRPPLHETLYAEMLSFPDERSLGRLRDLGVRYVVIHTDLYPPGEWETVSARVREESRLRLEHVAGTGRVYSIASR
jgi:hypothetical protein